MDVIKLIEPTDAYSEKIIEYRDECLKTDKILHGDGGLSEFVSLCDWFANLKKMKTIDLPDIVPSSTYIVVLIATNEVIGMVNIRHNLNAKLLRRGGNIGYSIHPKFRQMGYGTMMLKKALEICKDMDMGQALLTCREDNIASAKTILKCGGKEEATEASITEHFRRFWIEL